MYIIVILILSLMIKQLGYKNKWKWLKYQKVEMWKVQLYWR